MNRLSITFIALLLAIGTQVTDAQQSTGLDKLLAAAHHKAEVEGDLKGAIEEYKRVVDRAGANRPLAAQALIRMAEAYRKLGDAEAQQVYARIVRDYPDQRDAFTTASARLRASSQAAGAATLTTQRVLDQGGPWDRVSPDGHYIARVDSSTGNLVLLELATGRVQPLTVDGNPEDPDHRYPGSSAFSRDGKRIAYLWYFEKDQRSVLRITGTVDEATRTSRTVYDNADAELSPTDWSPDGRLIAVVIRRRDRTAQIGVVGAADGSLRVLKTVDWSRVGGLRFSPDSKSLAYHRPPTEGVFNRDVFIIAVDGSRETVAARSPGDDTLLEWTPDGQRLLISSDRGGSMSMWSVSTSSQPSSFELVKSDTGIVSSLGPTRTGTLFYNLLPSASNIYVANFDTASGRLSSPLTQPVQQFKGFNTTPVWSADGRYLAYSSRRDIPAPINVTRGVITILSMDTGEVVREVHPALSYGNIGQWSPDGRLFITAGADLKGRSGILKIDASTGETSLAVRSDTCGGIPLWSADGRSFFCYRGTEPRQIVQIDVTSGAVLRTFPAEGQAYAASPDGRYLQYFTDGPEMTLKIVSLATGETREVLTAQSSSSWVQSFTLNWTPDSRAVVFYGQLNGDEGMWLVPVDGRAPRKIDVGGRRIANWRFNPHTGQVAFGTDSFFGRLELWRMDNFLASTAEPAGLR